MRREKSGNSLTYTKITNFEKVKLPDGTTFEKANTYEKYEEGSPSICNVYNIGDNNSYVNQNNDISYSSNSGNELKAINYK
ncbi:hypothetical protein PVAND_016326 [Polypedilum vanderplanki]|uniref:Uncharacterized protein n=1 Tax=Polypedilum vanderplanki TaxID=319348 RepID=A0A9J6BFA6_POLVA|nr:hypothetical protein PVAND_016326 [Polypedilum vanderplanki]